ncbi:TlpA family protein disulfide reductase [Granulicella arctica]|uniref:TlpA family protein disulfide reductase n=1 Tax=Granulicella arctica TaxID=940613 RepID=UPI0021DF6A46|nr:hypothetical protein [Granulicella arctica]
MKQNGHPRLLVLLLLLAGLSHSPATSQIIPEVHGTTLSGTPVDLPAALKGKVGILVIGFSQGSRDAVTVWGKKLAADYYDSPRVLYYEMPVLASVPRLMRGFVTSRIKAAVSDRGKSHFIPLTEDEPVWRSLVHYKAPDDPYLLLVDAQGTVRWQTQGQASDVTYAAMKQQVDQLQAHQGATSTR